MTNDLTTSSAFHEQALSLRTKIDAAAETSRSAFASGLADLASLQAQEIERLNAVIEDATLIPPRKIVQIGVAACGDGSSKRSEVFALADDHSLWRFDADAHRASRSWERLPALPTAAQEVDVRRDEDETEDMHERLEREREMESEAGWR